MQTASDAQGRGAELPLTLHANAQTLFGRFCYPDVTPAANCSPYQSLDTEISCHAWCQQRLLASQSRLSQITFGRIPLVGSVNAGVSYRPPLGTHTLPDVA